MSQSCYSVIESVSSLIAEKAKLEFLAKMTVLTGTTLQSLNLKEGDIDLHYDIDLILLRRDFDTLFRLSMVSYFVDQNLGSLLRYKIDKECGSRPEFYKIKMICKSFSWFRTILQEELNTKSECSIFGFYNNEDQWSEKISNSFRIRKIRNHRRYNDPVQHQRYVGVSYKDKGHLPKSTDFPFSDQAQSWLQYRIEQERQSYEDLLGFIEGFLM